MFSTWCNQKGETMEIFLPIKQIDDMMVLTIISLLEEMSSKNLKHNLVFRRTKPYTGRAYCFYNDGGLTPTKTPDNDTIVSFMKTISVNYMNKNEYCKAIFTIIDLVDAATKKKNNFFIANAFKKLISIDREVTDRFNKFMDKNKDTEGFKKYSYALPRCFKSKWIKVNPNITLITYGEGIEIYNNTIGAMTIDLFFPEPLFYASDYAVIDSSKAFIDGKTYEFLKDEK